MALSADGRKLPPVLEGAVNGDNRWLEIADPARISQFGARPGDIGLGDPFSMPYVTIEAVLPIKRNRLLIVNDMNIGSTGRNVSRPDDSDFIDVRVPGLDDRGRAGRRPRPRGDRDDD